MPKNLAKDTTFTPPRGVASAAASSLSVRSEKPESERGMTPVGIRRATQLKNQQPVSIETLRRMLGYLSRHLVDKRGQTWSEKGKGWQAWNGWGGDAGARWAISVLSRYDESWFTAWRRAPRNAALMRHVQR